MTFTGPALNPRYPRLLWTPEGPGALPLPCRAEAGMAVTITVATPTAVVVELSSMRNKRNSSKEPMDQLEPLFNQHSSSGQVREELPSRIEETEALAMAGLVRRSSARLGYREEAE